MIAIWHMNHARPAPPELSGGESGALAFHRTMPNYKPTPIWTLDGVARALDIETLWVKDESSRLDLPSFKILGGAWAVNRLVHQLAGLDHRGASLDDLRALAVGLGPRTLCTATDGNHGLGIARMARVLGWNATVFVPFDTAQARIDAIAAEGAQVHVHRGEYDGAVAAAAAAGERNGWDVVPDVASGTYTDVPRWVLDGYTTIFAECDEQLDAPPTVIVVQGGVGGLAAAALCHYARTDGNLRSAIVEPQTAACLFASAKAGELVTLEHSHGSIMAGLNCGTPSSIAWPFVHALGDAFGAIDDNYAREAMRLLAAEGVVAGESGAAGLAGLLAASDDAGARRCLGLGGSTRALVINTEGATDPEMYRATVGRNPTDVRVGRSSH